MAAAAGSRVAWTYPDSEKDICASAELESRRVIEVQQLYVHSDYQGYGVGRALIDAAVQHARREQFEAIWLQVWSQAEWAIPFYTRNLFTRIGEIPYHIGDQTYDDLLMLREL
jgi:ribosomal protein S18 acetylase RimI-like enzyme